jgi:hypothetical protein
MYEKLLVKGTPATAEKRVPYYTLLVKKQYLIYRNFLSETLLEKII